MRCGKFEYDDSTGEFNLPGSRPRRLPKLVSDFFLLLIHPWAWWWANEKQCWKQRQLMKVVLWLVVGFLLLKAYKFGLAFLLWLAAHAYVWLVYAYRFLWAAVVWLWEFACECVRCFGPCIQQGWNWFWTLGDGILRS